jgi:methylthioribulose-1-phosphate dehydratase
LIIPVKIFDSHFEKGGRRQRLAKSFDSLPERGALAEIASVFYQRGWMFGTAGNLSARARTMPDNYWITASGVPKGQLEESDFLRISVASMEVIEQINPYNKPSAETSIHQVIYRSVPDAGACMHVHSIASCQVTNDVGEGATELPLPNVEMLKGLGVWEENPTVSIPLFENHLDVPTIARQIEQRLSISPPRVPALLIRNHGVTVWGSSIQEAFNRTECIEFIFAFLAQRRCR